jgi:hypothetical protein
MLFSVRGCNVSLWAGTDDLRKVDLMDMFAEVWQRITDLEGLLSPEDRASIHLYRQARSSETEPHESVNTEEPLPEGPGASASRRSGTTVRLARAVIPVGNTD